MRGGHKDRHAFSNFTIAETISLSTYPSYGAVIELLSITFSDELYV